MNWRKAGRWKKFCVLRNEQVLKWGAKNPKNLFLIDGSGAILSVILLGVVLAELDHIFGIPPPTLYFLATFPCLFAIYDFFCLVKTKLKMGAFLIGIAMMNLFYSFLSLGLALYHNQELTSFGWIYIVLEIIIVTILATVEYRVAQKLKQKSIFDLKKT